jgi:hypothetical protein
LSNDYAAPWREYRVRRRWASALALAMLPFAALLIWTVGSSLEPLVIALGVA